MGQETTYSQETIPQTKENINMEIRVLVEAPALVAALEKFASILEKGQALHVLQGVKKEVAQVSQAPVQQQPEPQLGLVPQYYERVQPPQQAPTQQYQAPAQVQQQAPVPTHQAPTQQQAPVQSVPVQAPSYSLDQLSLAATQCMDAGKRNELINLLAVFGVQSLSELPKEQYGAFATKLRELGAQL